MTTFAHWFTIICFALSGILSLFGYCLKFFHKPKPPSWPDNPYYEKPSRYGDYDNIIEKGYRYDE